jgi:hypothetical protein
MYSRYYHLNWLCATNPAHEVAFAAHASQLNVGRDRSKLEG